MKKKSPTKGRSSIEDLFLNGINAVDAYEITKRSMTMQGTMFKIADHLDHQECYELSGIKRILIAGFGKAACPMAQAVEQTMPDRITEGVIIAPHGTGTRLNRIDVIEAGHPIPDNDSVYGAQRIADMLRHADEHDLVVLLLSGGGSALCTSPAQGLTFDDLRRMNEVLLRSGANIEEINTIRKHISSVKGGQLARLAHPAKMAVLIISDVIGDLPHTIASGPAAPDPSTFCEARDVLQKYGLSEHTPPRVRARLDEGCRGDLPETPKPGDPLFRHTRNIIIANNLTALRSIARSAKEKGYESFILTSRLSGDTRRVARVFASMIMEFARRIRSTFMPACIISGGEMTTRVEGGGFGGRNADFCLSLVPIIKGLKRVQILAAGTDGIDGNTDAAGAIVNGDTYAHARALGLDVEQALADFDAYTFFKATGSLVITGPTRTNVMDIQIALID